MSVLPESAPDPDVRKGEIYADVTAPASELPLEDLPELVGKLARAQATASQRYLEIWNRNLADADLATDPGLLDAEGPNELGADALAITKWQGGLQRPMIRDSQRDRGGVSDPEHPQKPSENRPRVSVVCPFEVRV